MTSKLHAFAGGTQLRLKAARPRETVERLTNAYSPAERHLHCVKCGGTRFFVTAQDFTCCECGTSHKD